MTSYRGFSSFHSESVEVLIRRALPPRTRTVLSGSPSFALREPSRFLNHGAFGAPLSAALSEAQRWRERCESQPLAFMDRELLPALVTAVQVLAQHYAIADATRLMPTANATVALNAALRSVATNERDLVVLVRPGYASNLRIAEATGARVVPIAISNATRRLGADAVVAAFAEAWPRDAVAQCRGRVVVLLEHISSHDALRMPLEQLVQCIRRDLMPAPEQLVVVVDGAHAPGTVERLPLDDDSGVLYAGNLHKWFLAPRGAGFLRVPSLAVAAALGVHAPIASHGRNAGLLSEFVWDGNRDYSPWLTVPLVCDFWHAFGGERRAMAHAARVADAVESELCRRWSVPAYGGLNGGVPMRLIQVPARLAQASTSDDALALQNRLHARGYEVPIKSIDGLLYMRASFALYNSAADYVGEFRGALESEAQRLSQGVYRKDERRRSASGVAAATRAHESQGRERAGRRRIGCQAVGATRRAS
jgi:selenocysteine lyase/cysteine desulfurase